MSSDQNFRLAIPANAPLSEVQRVWLRGFLDGIASSWLTPGAATPEPARPGIPVTIIWGSQTGTCESLAKRLGKSLEGSGYAACVMDMAALTLSDLSTLGRLLVITSTYGDGEPPDNAAELHRELSDPDASRLEGLSFAVFALGDSNYPEFCKCGHDFDRCLHALGAMRVLPMVVCDVEFDEPFAAWSAELPEALDATEMAPAS